jgi:hypothetical protein
VPPVVVDVGEVVVVLGLVLSFLAARASALAVFVVRAPSALAAFVAGDEVVFVFPVALTVVVLGPLEVGEPAAVVLGPDVFGAFVVFCGDTFVVVPLDDTCCGFGADPFLPCAGSVVAEASTNAAAEMNAIIVRVMNPPEGQKPQSLRCKRHSTCVCFKSFRCCS